MNIWSKFIFGPIITNIHSNNFTVFGNWANGLLLIVNPSDFTGVG